MAHDPRLNKLRRRIHEDRQRRARHWKRRVAFLQALIAKRVARRHSLDRIVLLDGVPCTVGQKLFLLHCRKRGWDGVLVSCDRRENPRTRHLLHSLGLHTQVELIALGFPANPVSLSSHCGYSDGASYPDIPAGGRLPHLWMLGLDVTAWDNLLRIAHSAGYNLVQPYPASNEEHHVNLRSDPKAALIRWGRV